MASILSKQKVGIALAIVAMVWCCTACQQQAIYERLHNVKNAEWQRTDVPSFSFNITDTSQLYKVYVVIRHTNQYAYRNIWLNVGVQYPGDSLKMQQFELPMATNDRWLGVGMDDVFEHRVLLLPRPVRFTALGAVRFTLQHTMRLDPLQHLLQVGIRVEPQLKAQP